MNLPARHLDRRRCLLLLAALPAAAAWAQDAKPPTEVSQAVPGARLLGSGRLTFIGLRVYDARLWAATSIGEDWTAAPLALELEYLRDLDGEKIAERSLAEMRRQAEIPAASAERWLAAMKKTFPDVRAGDRLTGLLQPGAGARFAFNGAPRGEMRDVDFARLFFGIWLSPRTSEPALRSALLGAPTSSTR